jgi:hypothetical protein
MHIMVVSVAGLVALGAVALPAGRCAAADRVTTVWEFDGRGYDPEAGIVVDRHGNIFGTATAGGTGPCDGGAGCGTVYELSPPAGGSTAWSLTTLHNFQGGPDGGFPQSPVIVDAADNVYGYTAFGSQGTVYRMVPPAQAGGAWTYQTLYVFSGGDDGSLATSYAPLILHQGRLFGIANSGGVAGCGQFGCGTVFRLTPGAAGVPWRETTLYRFSGNGRDGLPNWIAGPDAHGAFYVATGLGHGAVLQFAPPSAGGGEWRESTVAAFTGGTGGNLPSALVLASDGNLYGAANLRRGSLVFQLAPSGGGWARTDIATVRVHAYGLNSLSAGPGGTLLGTVEGDFDFYPGDVFQLTPPAGGGGGAWSFNELWSFSRGPDRNPQNVVVGRGPTRADLFGVLNGGDSGSGTVFGLSSGAR